MTRGTPPNDLRQLRDRAGLSQRDVAERVNRAAADQGHHAAAATADMVSRWERGKVIPLPIYRRLLAQVFGVSVEELKLDQQVQSVGDFMAAFVDEEIDPRVEVSQQEWCRTRRALNTQRHALAQVAAGLYEPSYRLGATGLITHPTWLPAELIDMTSVQLQHRPDAPDPELDGTEPVTGHVRPRQTLVRRYPRYTHAVRDLAHPRLFENRLAWRIAGMNWADGGRMAFADTTYFAAVDVFEATAHELAYVALDEDGTPHRRSPTMRDLPLRKAIGDPFNLARRPVMCAISTLTIRNGADGADFLLHRRDSRSVAAAGGMLQVIPSGIFQPSSVMPAAREADFDLWRNVMREYSEELLGNPEHDGDGQPVQYDDEPFAGLDQARRDGQVRIYVLGVALDALTLVGELLTVAVFDAALFDDFARDFVERNDEGSIVNTRAPFTEAGIAELLASGRLAPAGAGCVELAWQHRGRIL
ncbi:helix-turn-helix domain-containing protein [Plantactinospora sp. CA-294935]|uniref:helix-turn-helix domain-containing protein n=1 Tax=Plantactinospora sp. CA-294935 TaxID=3240012 RepID=UPI003D8C2561